MKKKGQLVYKALLVMIASGMVIAAFVAAGKSYGTQEAYYRLAVARDLALTIDLVYALPGDLQFTYTNDVSDYDIMIKWDRVTVHNYKAGTLDPIAPWYNFVGIDKDTIDAEVIGHKFVKIEKINGKVKILGVDK